jgi:hypothetical protein
MLPVLNSNKGGPDNKGERKKGSECSEADRVQRVHRHQTGFEAICLACLGGNGQWVTSRWVHPSGVGGVLKQRQARPSLLLNAQWSRIHPSGVSNMLEQEGG